METALVSIIVPVYNVEKYLKKCVDSIINQTYKKIEIILIDDGSTDNSSIICDYYSKIDSRINVVHKKNGGLSDARNRGLDIANGEYICFIDSDDYVNLSFVEDLYNALIQVLVLLRDDAMTKNEQSHWEKVQNTLGLSSLEPKSIDFNFEKIIELKLEMYREQIEKIVKYARLIIKSW